MLKLSSKEGKWNYGLECLQKSQNSTNKSEMSHKFRPRTLEAKDRKADRISNERDQSVCWQGDWTWLGVIFRNNSSSSWLSGKCSCDSDMPSKCHWAAANMKHSHALRNINSESWKAHRMKKSSKRILHLLLLGHFQNKDITLIEQIVLFLGSPHYIYSSSNIIHLGFCPYFLLNKFSAFINAFIIFL